MLIFFLFACQHDGAKIYGDAPPRGNQQVFLEYCQQQHLTAVALKKATQKKDCLAAWKALQKVTHVDLSRAEISDLQPLRAMKNIESLTAYGKGITDITPLAELPRLRELSLMLNEIKDIQPLAGLRHLRTLRLDGNQIKDISTLQKLYKLEKISLDSNQISDFRPLAELEAIQALNTNGNPVDISKCPVEGDLPKQLRKYCKRLRKHQLDLQDAIDPKSPSPMGH